MSLKRGVLALTIACLVTGFAMAESLPEAERMYLTISKVRLSKVSVDPMNQERFHPVYEKNMSIPGLPNENGQIEPNQELGKIIATGRELVALGEDVYNLVIKGKPSVATDYAPISVIPRIGGQAVDILETEGWAFPRKVTYEIIYENFYGMTVVKFRYSVMFSYKGSYNGKGAYLTGAQIIPVSTSVMFGYDFNASMKLGGIQNNGTKENPVAGASLLLQYTVSTVMKSDLTVDSFFVTGLGTFKKL